VLLTFHNWFRLLVLQAWRSLGAAGGARSAVAPKEDAWRSVLYVRVSLPRWSREKSGVGRANGALVKFCLISGRGPVPSAYPGLCVLPHHRSSRDRYRAITPRA